VRIPTAAASRPTARSRPSPTTTPSRSGRPA
jgi:hypothetical protein